MNCVALFYFWCKQDILARTEDIFDDLDWQAKLLYTHLSHFMQHSCAPHMQVALHLLRYLKGSSDSVGATFVGAPWFALHVLELGAALLYVNFLDHRDRIFGSHRPIYCWIPHFSKTSIPLKVRLGLKLCGN
ncbi:hypothetical protein H5410_046932 [Solanum commersonii]|uniref:Uncharacterized protein n=1 Tax=Solanum commersonii TaxID=4109 RepID=A0A9J5XFS5_SOLCO|nr:hypothetical protein H5410_046932 [Solanum commersonii]